MLEAPRAGISVAAVLPVGRHEVMAEIIAAIAVAATGLLIAVGVWLLERWRRRRQVQQGERPDP